MIDYLINVINHLLNVTIKFKLFNIIDLISSWFINTTFKFIYKFLNIFKYI